MTKSPLHRFIKLYKAETNQAKRNQIITNAGGNLSNNEFFIFKKVNKL